jgi:hypothetical protein
MELYAVGFNAWNQLIFEPSMIEDEPDDLFLFKKVLGAEEISRPRPRLCYTTGTHHHSQNGATLTGLLTQSNGMA